MPAPVTVHLSDVGQGHAVHLPIALGDEIVLRGSYYSRHDGSVVDAATTTWPKDAPGGASVMVGGLFDLGAGGFELLEVDPSKHVIRAVVVGDHTPACRTAGVQAPCLLPRTDALAHGRLLTASEWHASLRGEIIIEHRDLGLGASLEDEPATGASSLLWVLALVLAATVWAAIGWVGYRRWARSHRRRLVRLLRRVGRGARRVDPILSRVLAPSLASTERALREGRFDPASAPASQLTLALERIQAQLQQRDAQRRHQAQRDTTDALLRELELAVDAASEASRAA